MKLVKRILAVVLSLCVVSAFSACSGKPRKPSAEDAEKHVRAALELLCTGDYDHSVRLAEENELKTTAEAMVDEAMDDLLLMVDLREDVLEDFHEVLQAMFSRARYTVGEATQAEDGFDVPVVMEPVALGGKVEAAVSEGAAALLNDPNVAFMTEEDLTNSLMRDAVNALRAELDDPQYGESIEVVVRFKELQDGSWGIGEGDGEKLCKAIFRPS